MSEQEIADRVENIVKKVLNDLGMSFEDFEMKRAGMRYIVRIFIEKEGGVTLQDCETASREIGARLDVEDPIPYTYTLEVSSPGLDRPLKKPDDFRRFCGRKARVITHSPIEKQTFFIGDIIEAGDEGIVLLLPRDRKVKIKYSDISRAKLEVNV
jgi:ribosome maturation factor RimP